MLFIRKAPKTTEKTHVNQMRFPMYFFVQQSLFEQLKKLLRHQWCSDS